MANANLKNALGAAGLTAEQFAEMIEVDPKTVQRWVSGRTPYPRHRATVARALGLTEHELWPDDVPPPSAAPATRQPVQTPAVVGDVTGSWGQTTDPNAPEPASFLASGADRIDLLDDGRGLAGMPGLIDALLAETRGGCQIRVLTPSPSSELAPLIGRDQIELRVFKAPAGASLIRAGDQLLLTLSVPSATGRSPALLQLHRQSDGGLFDRFVDYYQLLWDHARENPQRPQATRRLPARPGPDTKHPLRHPANRGRAIRADTKQPTSVATEPGSDPATLAAPPELTPRAAPHTQTDAASARSPRVLAAAQFSDRFPFAARCRSRWSNER